MLGQSTEQLRTIANSLEQVTAYLQQAMPQSPLPAHMQQMLQMFAPGAHAQPNGVPVPALAPVPAARGRKRRADVDGAEPEVDENGKKKRKRAAPGEKKVKDPNAPKRPPSAYLLFQNEVRKEMQEKFPNSPYHDVLNKISERWKKMSEEEKKVSLLHCSWSYMDIN